MGLLGPRISAYSRSKKLRKNSNLLLFRSVYFKTVANRADYGEEVASDPLTAALQLLPIFFTTTQIKISSQCVLQILQGGKENTAERSSSVEEKKSKIVTSCVQTVFVFFIGGRKQQVLP